MKETNAKTVLLETDSTDGEIRTIDGFYAYDGFRKLDWNVKKISYLDLLMGKINLKDLGQIDCAYGSVSFTELIFHKLGFKQPVWNDYPNIDNFFYQRTIERSTVGKIDKILKKFYKDKDRFDSFFIKPVRNKGFHVGKIKSFQDWIDFKALNVKHFDDIDLIECFKSPLLNIVTEWRCYVLDGKIIDVRQYSGRFDIMPNMTTSQEMVDNWINKPPSFSLDVGLTNKYETVLIETNAFHSLGNYGIDSTDYVKCLIAYWSWVKDLKETINFLV